MKKYYDLNEAVLPELNEIGGKAQSLIKLTQGGFNVPSGSVLSVDFFKDWLKQLVNVDSFVELTQDPNSYKELASKLKEKAQALEFTKEQINIIQSILSKYGINDMYAVRSSSPEEDLTGASFAGGYETVLGVTMDTIYPSVKDAFISCLDERVFFYKHQNDFDTSILRIAVVIQKQINSEVSGVGFSLNPLNNCFDEAVVNANSGLGESVVSGMVTPDEYVMDKVSMTILDKKLGSKEKAIILLENGGTKTVDGIQTEYALNDDQVLQLLKKIIEIENYYDFPVDIEWAFSKNRLYILQSRPITTYVPLPEDMQTKPDEKRVLYLDGSLTKQGITTPISFLGCDVIALTQSKMFERMLGKDCSKDVMGGLATTRGGRMYVNASSTIKFQGLKKVVKAWRTADIASAEMLETIDLSAYIPDKLPDAMKGLKWGAVKNNIGAVKLTMKASKNPLGYKAWYQPYEDAFDTYLDGTIKQLSDSKEVLSLRFETVFTEIINRYYELLNKMIPMTYAAELARKNIEKQLKKHFEDYEMKMQYLQRSLPDNVTIDMGLMMYAFSQMKEIKENSFDTFKHKLVKGKLSDEFLKQWENYVNQYGFRITNELDVAVVRPWDDLEVLFNQIKMMCDIDEAYSPQKIYDDSKQLREMTYLQLRKSISKSGRKKLDKKYTVLVELGGKREALKYWYARSLVVMRQILIKKAEEYVSIGVLKEVDDIFWLSLDQINRIETVSQSVLYGWIEKNKEYYCKLNRVHEFPKLIDSRGTILRMPMKEAEEGQLIGQPISPGIVTGRVKVLNEPNEKPLNKGEILVTRATDPGWTPLFINASAILLEVGGLLQHGALVAREYGKPCIAGIENVMHQLKDGQLIKIDAIQGIIEILDEDHEIKS